MTPYSATPDSEQPRVSRVLMTTDTVGGVWTYALELCRAMAPHGIDFVLATMGPRPSSQQQTEAARVRNLTLVESEFALEWMTDPWSSVAAAAHWLHDMADQVDPHLIHLNCYTHAALPWRVPVVVVAHSCVLSWWKAVKATSATAGWDRYRRHVRRGLKAADLVIAPTYAMADMLENHYGRLPKLRIIHNAVEHSHFSRGKKKPLILAAGRLWDEAKNIEVLAQAAKRVSWPVIVAGDACDPEGRSRQFENVRLVGRLDGTQMRSMMSRCAIYALPARYEPFGLTPLEAALSGCALVLGDIPTYREIWGSTALYADPGSADSVQAAITELIKHPNLRRELAEAANWRARTFTPGSMAKQYVNAYRQLRRRPRRNHYSVPIRGVMSCGS